MKTLPLACRTPARTIGKPHGSGVRRRARRNANKDKGRGYPQEGYMSIPITREPERCSVFAEPLTADVRFGDDHLELAMPTHAFHQPGETCQVTFELNGAQRVLACTLLWFSMHELVSVMGVGLG